MSSSWNFERVPLFARFFFLPRRLTYHTSTLPTVFWKQPYMFMNADIWTAALFPDIHCTRRRVTFPKSFSPFAATVDRLFFLPLVIPQNETRSVEHWLLLGSNDTLDFSSLHVNIYVRNYTCFHYTYYETCSRHWLYTRNSYYYLITFVIQSLAVNFKNDNFH